MRNNLQVANDKRGSNKDDEKDKHDEVKDREADDPSLTKFGLLEGVDRWANLTAIGIVSQILMGGRYHRRLPWTKPKENDGMELVDIWDAERWQHDKKQQVSQDEIRSEVTKLSDLAKEFTPRLGNRMPAHTVPFASPPSDVRLIMLELSGQREGDDELVYKTLDSSHGDHSEDTSRE